jgi:hypothetical protein
MADETSTTPPQGSRAGGNREPGGFRIRLSDNEMRSARALQEALRLRSTVAVLGFAVRALGQMLEEGKLDELVEQQRAQAGNRDDSRPRRGGAERSGPGRGPAERAPRVNPFARPAKPVPAAAAEEQVEPVEPSAADAAPAEEEPLNAEDQPVTAEAASQPEAEADTTPAPAES